MVLVSITLMSILGCTEKDPLSSNEQNSAIKTASTPASDLGLVDVPLSKLFWYHCDANDDDYYATSQNLNLNCYVRKGSVFYILPSSFNNSLIATRNFSSMYSPKCDDHLLSINPAAEDTNWHNEGIVGQLPTLQNVNIGLFWEIQRWLRTSTKGCGIHHYIRAWNNPTPGNLEGPLGWGWPKEPSWFTYSPNGQPGIDGHGTISYITKDNISIGYSWNWGGTIVSLTKNSGVDFVNRYDPGREIQSCMWYQSVPTTTNPTEGGDIWGNGSPIHAFDLPPTTPPGQVHTRTLCLNFNQEHNLPCDPNVPILSGTEIDKQVNIENSNRIYHAAKFLQARSNLMSNRQFVAFLNDEVFNEIRYYSWNDTGWSQPHTSIDPNVTDWSGVDVTFQTSKPAYIFCKGSNPSNCFALYRKNPTINTTHMGCVRCSTSVVTSPINPYAYPTVAVYFVEYNCGAAQESPLYEHYILVGTESEIRTQANMLSGIWTRFQDTQRSALSGGSIVTDNAASDHSAAKLSSSNGYISWNFNGTVTQLRVRYRGGSSGKTLGIYVNNVLSQNVNATSSSYATLSLTINASNSNNTIKVQRNGSWTPYIDYIEILP
jgi:hypothetical protein